MAVALIAAATLTPVGVGTPTVSGECCLGADILANIALFIPLGVGWGMKGLRVARATFNGAAASLAIEFVQRWVPGRSPSGYDVATNAAGALIGAYLVAVWPRRSSWWRAAGPAVALLIVTTSILGGFLTRPDHLTPTTWYGWAGEPRGPAAYVGTILGFEVQGIRIADGPVLESAKLTTRLNTDSMEFALHLIASDPTVERTHMASLVAEASGTEYLSVWQTGRAVEVFVRLATSRLQLQPAWLRLEGGLPAAAGDTMTISGTITRRQIDLVTHGGNRIVRARFGLSPSVFWARFIPFELATRPLDWLILFWMGLPFMTLGLCIRSRGALLAAIIVALWAGPLLAGGGLPGALEGVVAFAASLTGRFLALKSSLFPSPYNIRQS